MTWFKVDDSLHSHPKTMAVSLAAVGLWAVAGSWSSDHLTDGFIPDHMVTLLSRGQAELPKELCAAGLWKRTRGGFRFHQWHEDGDGSARNPSKEEVVAVRNKRAEAGRMGGLASGRSRSKRPDRDPSATKNSGHNSITGEISTGTSYREGQAEADRKDDLASGKAGSKPASKREANASAGASRIVQPPSRPVPSRRDEDGTGSHPLQVADARADDGREQLQRDYGLTGDKAEQAMTTISKLSKGPVKDWPNLLDHMAGNGSLATVVEPLQEPRPKSAPDPHRQSGTGCDTHPDGAVDPEPPDGWGHCLHCNINRRRSEPQSQRYRSKP